MPTMQPLAEPSDVEDVWRPLTEAETPRILNLIDKASAKLRQQCPFSVDDRMTLWGSDPTNVAALDPKVVADVVATIVKRFLVNPDGVASKSEGMGPFSQSGTYVNRYDKTGSDVRGAIQVTESDIDQLRPAVPAANVPAVAQVGIPDPQLLVPVALGNSGFVGPAVIPDPYIGRGSE